VEAEGHRPRAPGSTRAPHWRGGGIVFGPHPRDYRQDIPKKVRQLARRSALNARAREGASWCRRAAVRRAQDGSWPACSNVGPRRQKVLLLANGSSGTVYSERPEHPDRPE
jgi:large subunit ribosomal protein L4